MPGYTHNMAIVLNVLGQPLVFLSDLAVLLICIRIRENVHTVVLLGR